jgi:hypothetical protein
MSSILIGVRIFKVAEVKNENLAAEVKTAEVDVAIKTQSIGLGS